MTAEHKRMAEARAGEVAWRRWGLYLSDRQWGAVREDYIPHGTAWDYFSDDQAHSRAYRWGEDGLGGSHQTGWTGISAKLIQQYGEYPLQNRPPEGSEEA